MTDSKLHQLIALANEPSSERRRELLREVTDLFFTVEGVGEPEKGLFGDILTHLAGEMELAVREELAERMASSADAPPKLILGLARDSIAIAQPILQNSPVLSIEDQIAIALAYSQPHLQALSQRPNVSEAVTDVIVERGDDETLEVLLRNDTAELSRGAQEAAVDRAYANPALHEAIVQRQNLSPDLLNELYFVVETRLRDRILERNAAVDPQVIEEALRAGRKQVAARDGSLPADYTEAEADVAGMRAARGGITPQQLATMLRNRQTTRFLVALAELADIDFQTARRILEKRELDALAIVCKAAGFDHALFLTFTILILDNEPTAHAKAKQYGELFTQLPQDAAMRTVRFWRLRRQTAVSVAA